MAPTFRRDHGLLIETGKGMMGVTIRRTTLYTYEDAEAPLTDADRVPPTENTAAELAALKVEAGTPDEYRLRRDHERRLEYAADAEGNGWDV